METPQTVNRSLTVHTILLDETDRPTPTETTLTSFFLLNYAPPPHPTTKPSRGWLRVGDRKPRFVLFNADITRSKVTAKERTGVLGCASAQGKTLCPQPLLTRQLRPFKRHFFCICLVSGLSICLVDILLAVIEQGRHAATRTKNASKFALLAAPLFFFVLLGTRIEKSPVT